MIDERELKGEQSMEIFRALRKSLELMQHKFFADGRCSFRSKMLK